jgi:hypothetical protein
MAAKKVEIDERVVAIQSQMDEKVAEVHQVEQEQAELQALLDARIQQLKDSFQGKFDILNGRKEYLITEIRALFDQVPSKETKTQAKVTLLSGDVVVKKATVKLDYDKKVLLENAEATGLGEYIKTKEVKEFDWTSLKEKLDIQEDGSIVNAETGEVLDIEGLAVLPVAEQVVIK